MKQVFQVERNDCMIGKITKESMELLLESIIDAVESTEDRDVQFEMVKTILEGEDIVEVIPEEKMVYRTALYVVKRNTECPTPQYNIYKDDKLVHIEKSQVEATMWISRQKNRSK